MNSLQRHYNQEETDDADEVEPGVDYDEVVEPDFLEDRARSDLRCHAAEFLLCTYKGTCENNADNFEHG